MSGANAPTAENKQNDIFTTELQLNYSPDGVYLDRSLLCRNYE
jgi:hypothetical protein